MDAMGCMLAINFLRFRITLQANALRVMWMPPCHKAAYPTARLGRRRQARQNAPKVLSAQS